MAKGGYNRRRIEQKKHEAKEQRRRVRRRKLILTWVIAAIAAGGLITILIVALTGNGKKDDSLASSPTPSASASASPDKCHEPKPEDLGKKSFDAAPCEIIDTSKSYTATMKTSMGTVVVKLLDDAAPKTVNNFVFLAQQKYYDGSLFHRVIPDFGTPGTDMVQGGDPVNRDGTGGPGYQFGDENPAPFAKPGFLAMANAGPGTNGSQFFFLDGPVDHLNAPGNCPGPQGCHTVFGEVVSGLDVVNKIAHVERGEGDKPKKDVVLQSVTISEK